MVNWSTSKVFVLGDWWVSFLIFLAIYFLRFVTEFVLGAIVWRFALFDIAFAAIRDLLVVNLLNDFD